MSKQQPIIALYELRISVDTTGILVQKYKYPVVFTGKNYVPQMVTDEMHTAGYSYRLSQRVQADNILKVNRTFMGDKTDMIGRDIYYLEGQQAEATKLLREAMDETLGRMKRQMDAVHEAWTTRKDRPPRK